MQKNTGNNNTAIIVYRCWHDLYKRHFVLETMRENKFFNVSETEKDT